MRQAICSYAARAAEKLRGEHQYCRFVSAFVKTSPFALNEPYYGNSASLKLLTPTQDSRDIIAAATSCLDAIWKAGHRYQKAGVMLGDFYSQGVAQLNLFDELAPRHNSARLMQVLDQLNAKNGRGRSILPARDPAAVADEARDARRATPRDTATCSASDNARYPCTAAGKTAASQSIKTRSRGGTCRCRA
jgi:hypothetical protein